MAYKVVLTGRALADLNKIFDYINAESEQNAPRMIRTLLDAIDGLDVMPYRFNVPRVGKVRGRQVRSMPVRPYLVRYRIDEKLKAVFIVRISHGARKRP